MEGIKINTNYYPKDNNIVIVELGGYIDQTNSRHVEKVISDILKSEKLKIIFDLSELVYMSSAGWGIFVGEIKTVRDLGGDIKIACMSTEVYEVFQMLEFYHIIQDFATIEEAAISFKNTFSKSSSEEEIDVISSSDEESIEELLAQTGVKPDISIGNNDEEEIIMENASKHDDQQKPEFSIEEKKPVLNKKVEPRKQHRPKIKETTIDLSKLPINEKIKKVVANYPLLNVLQIRKILKHDKFGNTKVGIFKLYKIS